MRRGFLFGLALTLFSALGSVGYAADAETGVAVLANDAASHEVDADAIEPAAALQFSSLYAFRGLANGRWARGGLAADEDGNLYGTLLYDGLCDTCGLVYMLRKPTTPQSKWTYLIIHKFNLSQEDGIAPTGKLVFHKGAIYGTTSAGANFSCGCGSVFKLKPLNANRTQWAYSRIYRFKSFADGATPIAGIIFGKDEAIYGVTSSGGRDMAGTVFRLNGSGDANWSKTTLYQFKDATNGGPQGELVFGKDGALYGTTFGGGKYNRGTVFRMTGSGGKWDFKFIYHFLGVDQPGNSTDGADPEGQLIFGKDGMLYGTTVFGGESDWGTIFRLKKPKAGQTAWGYKIVHHFKSGPQDGRLSHSGLAMDSAGALYGTTAGGGPHDGGTVYKLVPKANGTYAFSLVHSFTPRSKNGDSSYGGVLIRGRTVYGPTITGGLVNPGALKDGKAEKPGCRDGCGTVYQLTP